MIFPVPNSSRVDRYCLELIKKDGYPGVYTLSPVSGRIFVEKSDIKPNVLPSIFPDIRFSIASLELQNGHTVSILEREDDLIEGYSF